MFQEILFTWFLDDIWLYRCTHLNNLQVGLFPLYKFDHSTLDRTQVHGFKLPGFNGAIQCGSGGAIGVHERLEESVPQDDPQWENMLKIH